MLFYDFTEITSTNLHARNFADMLPLPGLESHTGADYLIIPQTQVIETSEDDPVQAILSYCADRKDQCILIQRKTNSDFYNSIAKLPFIAMNMLNYSNNNVLFTTGKFSYLNKDGAFLACQSASLSWQLYYNGLYMHADTMEEFFQVLRQLDNRDLSKDKEIFTRQPREKFKLVGKSWAYILASLPRIGASWAKDLSDKYDNYPQALNAILDGKTTLGKLTVEKIRKELGL